MVSPPIFLHKKTLNFDLFLESLTSHRLTSHQQGTHLQNGLPLPSSPKPLTSPALGLSSLQGSSPSTSSGPLRETHLLGLSLRTLTPCPSCPFQDSPLPRVPPHPRRTLTSQPLLPALSLSSVLGCSPPSPSCPFLLSPVGILLPRALLCPPGLSPPASRLLSGALLLPFLSASLAL